MSLPKVKHSFQRDSSRYGYKKNYEDAQKQSKLFIEEYQNTYPETIKCLEEGSEDSLQLFHFDFIDHRCTSSTNVLERLNREVR